MIYAKAFRRGDGFYPAERYFPGSDAAVHRLAGHRLAPGKEMGQGRGGHRGGGWLAVCDDGVPERLPPDPADAVGFHGGGVVITSPLPLWTSITDGGWSFLLGGALLYALRGRRKVQLTVWALVIFLCDFVLTFGMACRQEGFVWTQMFTTYYEWFGVFAALLMLLYNGQRGSGHKQLFYWFYPAHVYLLYGASCLVYNVLR